MQGRSSQHKLKQGRWGNHAVQVLSGAGGRQLAVFSVYVPCDSGNSSSLLKQQQAKYTMEGKNDADPMLEAVEAVMTEVEAVESTHLVGRVEGSRLVVLAVSAVLTEVEAWVEKMVVATSVAAVAKVAGVNRWGRHSQNLRPRSKWSSVDLGYGWLQLHSSDSPMVASSCWTHCGRFGSASMLPPLQALASTMGCQGRADAPPPSPSRCFD